MAQENLRSRLNLLDGTAVKLTIWEEESNWKPPTPEQVITDWCEATRGVEDDWGREKAMGYLIGEKFLNFLERAETDREWRQAIPNFVAGIKSIFEPWQLEGLRGLVQANPSSFAGEVQLYVSRLEQPLAWRINRCWKNC